MRSSLGLNIAYLTLVIILSTVLPASTTMIYSFSDSRVFLFEIIFEINRFNLMMLALTG